MTLLRRYASVADRHGVVTNLTVTGPGRAGLSLLELGDSFVVAERFTVELALVAVAVRVVLALLAAGEHDRVDDQALDEHREEHDPDGERDERHGEGCVGEQRVIVAKR